ncbi:nitroreductase family protein [Paraburkholderia fungorum]
MITPSNTIDAALISRRPIHAFLPTPLARAEIEAILETVGRAPSGIHTP